MIGFSLLLIKFCNTLPFTLPDTNIFTSQRFKEIFLSQPSRYELLISRSFSRLEPAVIQICVTSITNELFMGHNDTK
jgi:hypothetical protein